MSLVAQSLNLGHGGKPHLNAVSAAFERGKLTTVIGRTLAGKTTLMRVIAGLQNADSGALMLDGKAFSSRAAWDRDVAMVYQQFINYPHLSVFENVAFPLRKKRVATAEIAKHVTAMLEKVGLSAFGERKPSQLSGGQQQRVALARALVRKADILLLDEPLVNLDYKLREQLRDEFRGLLESQRQGIIIYNTTEPSEAMMLGDQLVVMHEGRILQAGIPAEVFEKPASALVASIINDPPMNIIYGQLDGKSIVAGGGLRLPRPKRFAALPNGAYRFGLPANEMQLASSGIKGRVTFSEVSGSETFIHAETALGATVTQVEGVHTAPIGSEVTLAIPTESLFVFAAEGDGRLLSAPQQEQRP